VLSHAVHFTIGDGSGLENWWFRIVISIYFSSVAAPFFVFESHVVISNPQCDRGNPDNFLRKRFGIGSRLLWVSCLTVPGVSNIFQIYLVLQYLVLSSPFEDSPQIHRRIVRIALRACIDKMLQNVQILLGKKLKIWLKRVLGALQLGFCACRQIPLTIHSQNLIPMVCCPLVI